MNSDFAEEVVNPVLIKNRTKTFPGIARVMAEQWGGYITKKEEAT